MSVLTATQALISEVQGLARTIGASAQDVSGRGRSVTVVYSGPIVARYNAALGPLLAAAGGDGPTIYFVSQAAYYVLMAVLAVQMSGPGGSVRGSSVDTQPRTATPGTRDPNLASNLVSMRQQIADLPGARLMRAWDAFVRAVVPSQYPASVVGPRVEGL